MISVFRNDRENNDENVFKNEWPYATKVHTFRLCHLPSYQPHSRPLHRSPIESSEPLSQQKYDGYFCDRNGKYGIESERYQNDTYQSESYEKQRKE